MITTSDLTLAFSGTPLFEDINVKFSDGNCYGLIGANGCGKSTLLKIISGEIDATKGDVHIENGKRMAVLKQDLFAYDNYSVLETVLMGYEKLYEVYAERMALYDKEEMSNEDGLRIGELEEAFSDIDGYTAEADAATMLDDLGIATALHDKKMSELEAGQKIRVLLAQVLFSKPDIVLLDEPTNQLDYLSVLWLEKFLLEFKNLVIVVSHDRHFLNKVCTHIADLDFGTLNIYPGNYDFWKEASELAAQQQQDKHKKNAAKVQELENFVRRFSANASKSKQATSRKKLIEKIRPEDLPVSSRRSPYINFKPNKPCGDRILTVKNISYSENGEPLLTDVSFTLEKGDKVAIAGKNSVSKTVLLKILAGELTPNTGTITWGDTISKDYFPKDNTEFFNTQKSLLDWLSQFNETDDKQEIRGYLGRMLFSGIEVDKSVTVLSGGEKARAMFAKIMIAGPNTILLDEPTDHLDLESISSLNEGLGNFKGCLLFTSHDFELLNTVSNRVIEVSPKGMIDEVYSFHDYMNSERILGLRQRLY